MRLAVKTGAWTPSPHEWKFALEYIERVEPVEFARIMRLKIEQDRKRSMTGRLLLRYACSKHSGLPLDQVRLERTDRNKPHCLDLERAQVNISHHGDWVVLASDETRALGVDVMRFEEPVRGRDAFFFSMQRQFTESEWKFINNSLEMFYTFWALKESYIKGIGIGLGFNLQRASFTLLNDERAQVEIDGKLNTDWEFHINKLDKEHVAAVALGPCRREDVTDITPFETLTPVQLLSLFGNVD